MLRTKYQYSIEKTIKIPQRLENRISDNKPLQGGNLLIHHINFPIKDDSK
jgi:hypothetical protein